MRRIRHCGQYAAQDAHTGSWGRVRHHTPDAGPAATGGGRLPARPKKKETQGRTKVALQEKVALLEYSYSSSLLMNSEYHGKTVTLRASQTFFLITDTIISTL